MVKRNMKVLSKYNKNILKKLSACIIATSMVMSGLPVNISLNEKHEIEKVYASETLTYSEDDYTYTYEILNDGTVKIINCSGGYDFGYGENIIPRNINGMDVTVLGSNAFSEISAGKVTIPGSVRIIENDTFSGWSYNPYIKQLIIEEGVEEIGDNAFGACSGLEEVIIPSSVKSIGAGAFLYAPKIEKVELSKNINYIGNGAFAPCKEVVLSTENEYYIMVDGILYNKGMTRLMYCSKDKKEIDVIDTVVEIDDGAFSYCKELTNVTLNEKITKLSNSIFYNCNKLEKLIITDKIKSIGESAFSECTALKEIELPDNITEINDWAFSGCKSLERVKLPSELSVFGAYIFKECSKLEEVNIPDNVTEIGNGMFIECDSLKSIELPDSLLNIGVSVFAGCESLENIELPETLVKIEDGAFLGCKFLQNIIIPESVTEIGASAFYECESLVYIKIPKNVTIIEPQLFYGCNLLKEVVLPEEITSIGSYAFYECSSLNKINLSEGIVDIESHAFASCISIEEVLIPKSVENIGNHAFDNCISIEDITIPGSIKKFNDSYGSIFYNCSALKKISFMEGVEMVNFNFYGCDSLKTIDIPSTVMEIENIDELPLGLEEINVSEDNLNYKSIDGVLFDNLITGLYKFPAGKKYTSYTVPESVYWINHYAFEDCKFLEEIVLSENVSWIGYNAFANCELLKNINIPELVTYIGAYAFYDCKSLEKICVPDGVNKINQYTFDGCSSLVEVNFSDKVTEIGWSAFSDCDKLENLSSLKNIKNIDGWAFNGCKSLNLTTVDLENVESIGNFAFNGCELIEEVNISSNVNEIGVVVFADCSSLKSINIPQENTKYKVIDGVLFDYNVSTLISYPCGDEKIVYNVPDSVEKISDSAFSGASNLKEIYMNDNVVDIGEAVFKNSKELYKVVLSNNIKYIDMGTFAGCEKLCDIQLPDSVKSIGLGAFSGCNSLKEIVIPASVSLIDSAFSFCENLEKIEVAEENENFILIDGVLFYKSGEDRLTLVTYPAGKKDLSYTVPSNVDYIDTHSFSCSKLEEIFLSENVEWIGWNAFESCKKLEKINIPSKVTGLLGGTFDNCESLEKIVLPETIGSIKEDFDGCHSLKEIWIYNSQADFWPSYGIIKNLSGDLKIYGKKGSKAEKYAKEYNLDYIAFDVLTSETGLSVEYTECNIKEFGEVSIISKELTKDDEEYNSIDLSDKIIDSQISPKDVEFKVFSTYLIDKNSMQVKPINVITINIPVPSGYVEDNCKIYELEDGKLRRVNFINENGILKVNTKDFGIFLVTETELRTKDSIISGDTNGDGEIDIKDSALIKRYLAGADVELDLASADVDGDGEVTIKDSALIKRKLAGWE